MVKRFLSLDMQRQTEEGKQHVAESKAKAMPQPNCSHMCGCTGRNQYYN